MPFDPQPAASELRVLFAVADQDKHRREKLVKKRDRLMEAGQAIRKCRDALQLTFSSALLPGKDASSIA